MIEISREFLRIAGLFLQVTLLLLAYGLGGGCRTVDYYGQAIRGQIEMSTGQETLSQVIRDPHRAAEFKDKLKLALQLREFAENHLQLPAGGNYRKYKDLNRNVAVWVVAAAPEFSIQLKSWWYPVIGNFDSRGFFSKTAANKFALRLKEKGYDVSMGGAVAYSTLGWFRDPVLNTFLEGDDTSLAETLFHELAHRKFFVNGDTAFNESYATACAQAGVQQWLLETGNQEGLVHYRDRLARTRQLRHAIQAALSKLDQIYKEHSHDTTLSPSGNREAGTMRKGKQAVIAEFRGECLRLRMAWNDPDALDHWIRGPVNNARLSAATIYLGFVPAFDALWKEHHRDPEGFHDSVRELGKLDKAKRHLELHTLLENRTDHTAQ